MIILTSYSVLRNMQLEQCRGIT